MVAEIGLNHLGNKKLLHSYLKLASRAYAITIQILLDSFYQDKRYASFKLSDYDELDKIILGLVNLGNRVKLIHTQLSNEIQDVNLKAIEVMGLRYKVPIAPGHHCIDERVVYSSLGISPDEFSKTVLFLASDEASYINGVALPLDGGSLKGVS